MFKSSRCAMVVLRPDISPGRRVLAVSDIHGNLPFLKGVLEKARFSTEDVLILLGDILEKGRESLGVLRYVMELSRTHTVYSLCGNCDHIDREFFSGAEDADRRVWPIYRWWRDRSLPAQLGKELGIPTPRRVEDLAPLRQAVLEHFPQECQFVMGLPHILEAGNFLFVHGGVPREDRLEELDPYQCMKDDDFLGQGLSFRKWVVVGHWPVTLYHADIPGAAPLILRDRHIISIDGGCVLKADGQLNALIIPDLFGDQVDWVAYDGLPEVTALDHQDPSSDSINIRWSDSVVEVLRTEGDCAWCRHLSSGRELWVPESYLERRADGLLHVEDTTDHHLAVEPGDTLSFVLRCDRGYLVKRNGLSGWYTGRLDREPERKSYCRRKR